MTSYVHDFFNYIFKPYPGGWYRGDFLGVYSRIRNPLLETIDSLPEKDFVKDQVKSVADDIPSSDYVHEKIDDYVEVLGSAVEEFNETD